MTTNIPNYAQYAKIYGRSKVKPTRARISVRSTYIALGMILAAINTLSFFHTVPVVQLLFHLPSELSFIVGVAGFLSVEIPLVLFMTLEERSRWVRSVIAMTFIAAVVSNLYGTFTSLELLDNPSLPVYALGVVFGLFVPMANLAVGETFRNTALHYKKLLKEATEVYEQEMADYVASMEKSYRNYLSRMGIKGEAQTPFFLNENEVFVEKDIEELKGDEQPSPPKKKNRETKSSQRLSREELASRLVEDGMVEATYADIQDRYGSSPPTISKAKKLVTDSLQGGRLSLPE